MFQHAHVQPIDEPVKQDCPSTCLGDSGKIAPAPRAGSRAEKELDGTPMIFARLYRELHRSADRLIRVYGSDLALDATTLLHETYLDLAQRNLRFHGRPQFFAYAGRAMRAIIINHVRRQNTLKRGAALILTSFEDDLDSPDIAAPDTLDATGLREALKELTRREASLAELVDLKFFCGLSFGQIAVVRAVSERTVQRDWKKARLFLLEMLRGR
jgi:RNA polymerase sigma factor (TIGR02999 family)